jgi:hypothetical protein
VRAELRIGSGDVVSRSSRTASPASPELSHRRPVEAGDGQDARPPRSGRQARESENRPAALSAVHGHGNLGLRRRVIDRFGQDEIVGSEMGSR